MEPACWRSKIGRVRQQGRLVHDSFTGQELPPLGSHHEGTSTRNIVQDLTITIPATMLKRLSDAIRVEKAATIEPHPGMTHGVITWRGGKRLLKIAFELG